jgi:Protein of unknown function (DUF3383)
MTALSIDNVVTVSASAANIGINAYNTSNLAIVTGEATAAATQNITFSDVAASGAFVLKFGTLSTASIAWNATASTIQADINALSGLGSIVVTGSIASKTLTLSQPGNLGAITVATVPTNTLENSGSVAITVTPATVSIGWSGGNLGYSIYTSPTQVGLDFGTSSRTFQMADAVFSQQPNILANNGQLIVILRNVTQQTLTFSAAPTSGNFTIEYNGNTTTSLAYTSTPVQIQAALQLLPGLADVQVTGEIANELVTVIFNGVYGVALPLTIPSNTLEIGTVPVTVVVASSVAGETYGQAITRTQGLVQYFGVMPTETLATIGQTDMLVAAAIILPLNLIGFFGSYNTADIEPGGMIDLLRSGDFNNVRGLYYGDSSNSGINAITYMASYAGLGLSVNFNGSNTTTTMHLKSLLGVQPDPTMTQTILNLAQAAGADCYVSLQGDSAVFTSGANQFYDYVYNLEWFIGALQVAGYNYLAQSSTKVPQTEQGMDGLKGSYRTVCNQAVSNQYLAPGTWTSSTTFGNQGLFLQNISQYGYYIYSSPISQQLATARAARQAPLVQIAVKSAGAIQSSDVLVYVNA